MQSATARITATSPVTIAEGLSQLAAAFEAKQIAITKITLQRGQQSYEQSIQDAPESATPRQLVGEFEDATITVFCLTPMPAEVNAELQSLTTSAATAAASWSAPVAHLTLVKASSPYLPNFAPKMIGNSEPMRELLSDINRAARAHHVVLIIGESGTGKTTAASMIHERSPRAAKQFVSINCAAIPETLVESELFGYEKGAFTGAVNAKKGLFETAEGGTLFLDEIGELKLELQAKLLTAIEQQQIRRLGGTKDIQCDVRILAASSRDLHQMVTEGKFREDLYYRLSVLEVPIAPLRDRREDIPLLVNDRLTYEQNRASINTPFQIEPGAIKELTNYLWPGNIRQLHNVIARLATRAYDGTPITTAATRKEIARFNQASTNRPLKDGEPVYLPLECRMLLPGESLAQFTARVKLHLIEAVKLRAGGMTNAAARLGYDRSAFSKLHGKLTSGAIDEAA